MLNKINQTQDNTTWYHLYEESKIIKLTEAESTIVVARGCGEGEAGKY